MARDGTRLARFTDGANAHATAKALGFDFDYKRLLTEFQSRGTSVRAFYYTAIFEDQEYSSIRPLIDWLAYNGFTVVTKPAKEFDDGEGRRKFKRSMRVELAVDALEIANQVDNITLVFRRWGFLLATRSRAAPRRPRHRHFQFAEHTTDDRRRIATPSGYFHRTR